MAGTVNKVILVGNLGKDPEIRTTPDGKEVANISVATSAAWNDKKTGARRVRTEWHRVVVLNDHLVGIVKRDLHKGSKVYINGELQTRRWTDQGNIERYATEVILQGFSAELVLLSGKEEFSGGGVKSNPDSSSQQQHDNDFPIDDEIPF